MVGILRKRRGLGGKGRNLERRVWLGLGEGKRKNREIAVRNMSGRLAVGLVRWKFDLVLLWALFIDCGGLDMLLTMMSC